MKEETKRDIIGFTILGVVFLLIIGAFGAGMYSVWQSKNFETSINCDNLEEKRQECIDNGRLVSYCDEQIIKKFQRCDYEDALGIKYGESE